MNIIVDSNILFTFFWKNSTFSILSKRKELKLFAPEYALEEIRKYEDEIIKKTKISKEEFKIDMLELLNHINFVNIEDYRSEFKNIKSLVKIFKEEEYTEFLNDIDFIALALKINAPLWTHDKLLKKQNRIKILSTKEIIELL